MACFLSRIESVLSRYGDARKSIPAVLIGLLLSNLVDIDISRSINADDISAKIPASTRIINKKHDRVYENRW
jgi:hypothetical protein